MAQDLAGPRFTFKFPEKSRLIETDPKTITFIPLSLEQEMHGNKLMAAADGNAFEKIKLSIVALDGNAVDWAGGGLDAQIGKCSPTIRELIIKAYSKIHLPSDEDTEAFLAGVSTVL